MMMAFFVLIAVIFCAVAVGSSNLVVKITKKLAQ